MLSFDLSHQAEVLASVRHFIELSLNFEISDIELISYLEQLVPAFKAFDQEEVEYSVIIQAFKNIVQFVEDAWNNSILVDCITQLSSTQIKQIRQILVQYRPIILEEIRKFRGQELDNQNAFSQLVKTIIYDHYKVLFVRVDLGYLKSSMPTISVKSFYAHIDSLLKFLKDKNGCFRHLLSYGIALEQGYSKGYHGHLLLIYNGSNVDRDWYLADQVVKKWEYITNNVGSGRNLNTKENKEDFRRKGILGIGMIERQCPQAVCNALKVAKYLVEQEKFEQMLLVKPKGRRSFFKGGYKPHGRQYQLKIEKPCIEQLNRSGIWNRSDTAWLDELSVFDQ